MEAVMDRGVELMEADSQGVEVAEVRGAGYPSLGDLMDGLEYPHDLRLSCMLERVYTREHILRIRHEGDQDYLQRGRIFMNFALRYKEPEIFKFVMKKNARMPFPQVKSLTKSYLQKVFNQYSEYKEETEHKITFSDWVMQTKFPNIKELEEYIEFGSTAHYKRSTRAMSIEGNKVITASRKALRLKSSRGNSKECHICYKNTIDVVTACGHTFCISCAKRLKTSEIKINCPDCRQITTVSNIYDV